MRSSRDSEIVSTATGAQPMIGGERTRGWRMEDGCGKQCFCASKKLSAMRVGHSASSDSDRTANRIGQFLCARDGGARAHLHVSRSVADSLRGIHVRSSATLLPPSAMGFDDNIFVQPPASIFTCPVCHDVLDNPVAGCVEGHSFCLACVLDQQQCPSRG